MCLRIDAGRPIAHVAAEAGISRSCPAKWYARRRAHGENGLLDHSSRPPRTGPGTGKVGYTYLHSALDDHSRLACTEALDDEKAVTAVAFRHRAVAFFVPTGSHRVGRILTGLPTIDLGAAVT
ncbi:helix-turn-helix domain-containing protein [Streptomyces sp. NBC_01092]|uniref:helix-turn-helix domain-containing protein n=1 Tax=Streptomyces sp. NBC_01092 TaxID=2903748 RepID=UPI00386E3A8C